jgi:membrane protein involved in D-alanine export
VRRKKKNSVLSVLAVALAILPLVLVKWRDVFTVKDIGFLGISYLTFRCVQVILDIGKGSITDIHLMEYLDFVIFWPAFTSGPIDRFKRFTHDAAQPLELWEFLGSAREGVFKLVLGILYKFVLAALVSTYWLSASTKPNGLLPHLSYMYAYTFFLFFDFAGYSFMAVGASRFFGIRTPDNFNLPFLSRDIKEFWGRWHISLSFWFRDYIYTPIVMQAIKSRKMGQYAASYLAYCVTMLTMGLWHGRQLHYLAYGAYHALLLILTDLVQRTAGYKKVKNKKWFELLSVFITFNLICFGMLIFSGTLFI